MVNANKPITISPANGIANLLNPGLWDMIPKAANTGISTAANRPMDVMHA